MKALLILLLLGAIGAPAWYLPAKSRHHFSETGMVYTTSYVTVRLPTGVVGFPAGSRLQSRFDIHVLDKELVTDGKYTLALDPATLTHDMEYAGELAEADQQGQDAAGAGIEHTRDRIAASRRSAELLTAQDIDQVNSTLVASSTVGNFGQNLRRQAGTMGYYGSAGAPSIVYAPSGNTVNSTTNVFVARGSAGGGSVSGPVPKVSQVSMYGPQPTVDKNHPSLVAQ